MITASLATVNFPALASGAPYGFLDEGSIPQNRYTAKYLYNHIGNIARHVRFGEFPYELDASTPRRSTPICIVLTILVENLALPLAFLFRILPIIWRFQWQKTLGHETNILDTVEGYIPDTVVVSTPDLAVGQAPDPVAVSTLEHVANPIEVMFRHGMYSSSISKTMA